MATEKKAKSGVDAGDFIDLLSRMKGASPPASGWEKPQYPGWGGPDAPRRDWVGSASDGHPARLDGGLRGGLRGLFGPLTPRETGGRAVEDGPALLEPLVNAIWRLGNSGTRAAPETDAWWADPERQREDRLASWGYDPYAEPLPTEDPRYRGSRSSGVVQSPPARSGPAKGEYIKSETPEELVENADKMGQELLRLFREKSKR